MKTFYSLLLLLPVLFTSCKKNSDPDPQPETAKKYKVTFIPQLFDPTITDFKVGSVRVSVYPIPDIYSRLYDLDHGGERIVNDGFLAAGHYLAVFLATNNQFNSHSGLQENYFEDAYFDTRELYELPSYTPLEAIFYKKVYFTVFNQEIELPVVVKRIVAGLEVILDDVLPPAVSRIEVAIEDKATFHFQNDSKAGEVTKISSFVRGTAIRAYVLGTGTVPVKIRAYDEGDNLLAEKHVDATFQENRKTTLKGKLFSSQAVTFNLSIDRDWDTAPVVIPF